MRSSTGAEAAAILAVSRLVTPRVSINGSTTTWPVTEFQTDAQMTDTPAQISLLGGVAARQVTFKIDHTFYKKVSPYQASIVPAANPLPIGATVQVTVQLGTRVWTIFTGNVIQISNLDAVSDITVMAQDSSYGLGTSISLPAAGVTSTVGLDKTLDLYYSPLVIIDLCLRGCGQYLTAPPVLTGANRAAFTTLSIPGVGGNVPDVGGLVQQFLTPGGSYVARSGRSVGKFTPDVVGSNGSVYSQNVNIAAATAQPFQLYRVDCWFKSEATLGGGANPYIVNGTPATGGSCPTIGIDGSSGNVSVACTGVVPVAFTATNVLDGGWHHLNASFTRPSLTSMTLKISIDGGTVVTSTQVVSATVAPFPASLVGDGGNWLITAGDTQTPILWTEALEVVFVPAGATYSDPADRNGQAAGLASTITATTARLQAIVPQTGLNAWQTIQSVAAAEGALCWFDEDGRFIFEPRTTWLARRTQAAARTFDTSSMSNVSMSLSADGLRKSVSANYQTVTALASTAASPAYTADAVLQFNPGTTTTAIQTDQLFFNPTATAPGATNAVGNSWFWAVMASAVGDPAAVQVTGVTVSVQATATGFNLTVQNPYPAPIAFWNPTAGVIPQGPALIIHGTRIVVSDSQKVTNAGSPTASDDLTLDDNSWRQSQSIAQQLTVSAAADCYSTIPVFQSIDVPGDPRVQLGDVVNLLAPHLPNGVSCVVVDIAHNVSPSSDYRMTLGVRPVAAPTGWVLGVTGRSELGTTTYLPLPG